MTTQTNGGPAFPHSTPRMNGLQTEGGMTLRDYFAAKAAPVTLEHIWKKCERESVRVDNVYDIAAVAAYEMAEAMLKAREK